ncbi:MFS transporter [Acidisoma silvae]|uniref:MFS transporter n=1 Tax=Acidisoma silvae TaxID=2802396 RepID=A0A963YVV3_9PROT|nr:MFS transporter [Acidisoma silvae]MCB8878074.1 MFS transporter [Acidisoma silvae]
MPDREVTGLAAPRAGASAGRVFGSSWSWAAMGCLWSIYAMNTNMRQWFQILQPSFVKEFHLDASRMGLYSGILMIALSVSGTGLAPWLDRGGHGWARKYRHLPIALCYFVFTILTGIGPLTTTFGAIFAFQLVKNLASGIGETAEVTAVAEWWPVEQRGFAQGLHHTAFPWGSLLGGLAISAVLSIFGDHAWRLVFLILPWILVPLLIIYWRFATPRNYAAFVDDTKARGLTPPLIETTDGSVLHAAPGAFGRALRNPNILVSSLVCGLCNFSYYGLGFWLPLYLAFVAHYPMAKVAAYSVIFTITGGIGQIVWGLIADRFGRKYSMVAMCIWLAVAYMLFRYIGTSVGIMIAIQLFIGMAINGVYPALYAISSDSTEKGAVAIANGLNMGGAALGGLGTIAVGYIIQAGGGYSSPTGFMISLYLLAGVMVLAAVLMALFTRETTGPFIHLDRALVSRVSCLRSGQ